jgi:CRP/FNR family transcriptional regulator, anaerobic regulatory protein
MLFQKTLREFGLQEPDIEQVMNAFKEEIKFKNGEYFIQNGETVKGMGFILEGAFRYFYLSNEGEEKTCWASFQGDFITSISSLVRQQPTRENMQAMKDSTIVFAPKKDWDNLLNQNQNIKNIWLKSIEANYIGMEERVHNLIVFNAEQRYEWMCRNQSRFINEIPDKYIASMLGITPRHLTRLRAKRK